MASKWAKPIYWPINYGRRRGRGSGWFYCLARRTRCHDWGITQLHVCPPMYSSTHQYDISPGWVGDQGGPAAAAGWSRCDARGVLLVTPHRAKLGATREGFLAPTPSDGGSITRQWWLHWGTIKCPSLVFHLGNLNQIHGKKEGFKGTFSTYGSRGVNGIFSADGSSRTF